MIGVGLLLMGQKQVGVAALQMLAANVDPAAKAEQKMIVGSAVRSVDLNRRVELLVVAAVVYKQGFGARCVRGSVALCKVAVHFVLLF